MVIFHSYVSLPEGNHHLSGWSHSILLFAFSPGQEKHGKAPFWFGFALCFGLVFTENFAPFFTIGFTVTIRGTNSRSLKPGRFKGAPPPPLSATGNVCGWCVVMLAPKGSRSPLGSIHYYKCIGHKVAREGDKARVNYP